MSGTGRTNGRSGAFLLFLAAWLVLYRSSLWALFRFAWNDDTFSYIPLVPLVSAYLAYQDRGEIFREREGWHLSAGAPILAAAALYAYGIAKGDFLGRGDYLAVMTASMVACNVGWIGLTYGPGAWKAAAFPLLFLVFMIPLPKALLDPIVSALQRGSAEISYGFFQLAGVPVYRDGFTFSLPGLSIEVARECSGIRSSLSLVLTSLIAGHLFLRRAGNKLLLVLSVVPITVFKNGVRIVTLALLGAYVDRRILGSRLHQNGGILFFVMALGLMGLLVWGLRRREGKGAKNAHS